MHLSLRCSKRPVLAPLHSLGFAVDCYVSSAGAQAAFDSATQAKHRRLRSYSLGYFRSELFLYFQRFHNILRSLCLLAASISFYLGFNLFS